MKRKEAESCGIEYKNVKIASDRESQLLISSAVVTTLVDPEYVFNWKSWDGTAIQLNADDIKEVAKIIRDHVQKCFDHEIELIKEVEKCTTEEELDAIRWDENDKDEFAGATKIII